MPITGSEAWTLLLSGGNTLLLLGIIWRTAAWKTDVEAQIEQHRKEIDALLRINIHPEAARRISLVEQEGRLRDRELLHIREDMIKRLERMENKLDRIVP